MSALPITKLEAEELRYAILAEMRTLSRSELERLATGFKEIGRPDLAKMCRNMAATKPMVH